MLTIPRVDVGVYSWLTDIVVRENNPSKYIQMYHLNYTISQKSYALIYTVFITKLIFNFVVFICCSIFNNYAT